MTTVNIIFYPDACLPSGRQSIEEFFLIKSGKCQVILPCYGDRIFAQTEDYEMAFTIPYSRISEVLEGLEGTQKGGIRYPVPSFLRYEGKFPEKYRIIEEDWKE